MQFHNLRKTLSLIQLTSLPFSFFEAWAVVSRDEYISIDLEKEELHIKTDSTLGSSELLDLKVFDPSSDTNIAGLYINFGATMKYHVGKCTEDSSKVDFGSDQSSKIPTSEKEKIWRITERVGSLRIW